MGLADRVARVREAEAREAKEAKEERMKRAAAAAAKARGEAARASQAAREEARAGDERRRGIQNIQHGARQNGQNWSGPPQWAQQGLKSKHGAREKAAALRNENDLVLQQGAA